MSFPPISNAPRRLQDDGWLAPYGAALRRRSAAVRAWEKRLTGGRCSLADFASGHEYFGLHRTGSEWVFREWAPQATGVFLIGEPTGWREASDFALRALPEGCWEGRFPADCLRHGSLYRLRVHWDGGCGDRIPAYARRVVQDPESRLFNAQVWSPAEPYCWRNPIPPPPQTPLVYECHVGMAQEDARIGTYDEFRRLTLPRIRDAGYNTLQIMAVQEHPYYGSFGYHVSSFFAASSRFGTPDAFKALVDEAHGQGLRVIIDLVHSHAVGNEVEGLARFDGTSCQYFHEGPRGRHAAWDSCCFDYGKPEVLHFLLSNCRFWLDEYHLDGFRFDGITSMMYAHHGLGRAFAGYEDYFGQDVDEEALAYLALANRVIHAVRPDAVTIAEDVSGMPGLGAPPDAGGMGFDYRLALGVTDMWFRMLDMPDESWPLGGVWHELVNRRPDERTISYVECHDQAIVGGQTLLYRLLQDAMYDSMHAGSLSLSTDRGMALHKMIRLATLATAGHGYLNFMGNEFGHPEWVDFPRQGNQWSYHHARRLWSLSENPALRYRFLAAFDRAMLSAVATGNRLAGARPQLLAISEADRILAFERGGLFFFLNLHPQRSFTDYPIEALPGKYRMILDTDRPEFGGHGRLAPDQTHETTRTVTDHSQRHLLRLYLPARSAVVLQRIPPAPGTAT
ncbi:MAG: alpha amylase C-terminal domain-containing protein [Lentisphaeria bacterium]|nr:alpha amylase C-terminal domain-containing protein [Lentisphaeria bacterium]